MTPTRDAFNSTDEFHENCKDSKMPSKPGDPDFAVVYKGCFIPTPFNLSIHKLNSFKPRPGDICIMTFPKTGQTLTSAILIMIDAEAHPEALHHGAPLKLRVPYLEMAFPRDGKWDDPIFPIDHLEQQTGPRIYGTHHNAYSIPAEILDSAKIVYVYRNPKDTIVSMFHFLRSGSKAFGFNGTISDVVDMMFNDRCLFAPFFDHLEGIWRERHRPNVCITSYEQIVKNPRDEVKKLAHFLERDLSDEQVADVIHHCSFDEMKKNKNTNFSEMQTIGFIDMNVSPFMRSGKVGDWKNHLTVILNEKIDAWIRKNFEERPRLAGLKFEYE